MASFIFGENDIRTESSNGSCDLRVDGDLRADGAVDLNGAQDIDVALTAAGDGMNLSTTINHATAAAESLDVAITQLTTARTSGTVSAIKSRTTSLAGDSGGTYINFEGAITDGGGSATHTLIKAPAGLDIVLDVSAAATGESDVVMADNLADAFSFREGSNSYLSFVTTNSSEAVKVDKTLDLNNNLDLDLALTAAGDNNIAVTINHATAAVQGLDLSVAQLTTARTSGTVDALAVATTSLAGDSGGTYNGISISATDGGGVVTHQAIKVGAGHDVLIDISAAATGESDVLMADNLASAFEIREGANVYMTFVTTNSSEAVQVTKTLDVNTNLDLDHALTAAGDMANVAGTIDHATANAYGVNASVVQLTTARTGGQVGVFKAASTSLAGDLNSVKYVDYIAAAPTDGGGTVLHTAMLVEAGHDVLFDLTAAATGESDINIADNLASALEIREAANIYTRYRTTNNLEYIEELKPVEHAGGIRRMLYNEIYEDFHGKASATLPTPWVATKVGTDNTATYGSNIADGVIRLTHSGTSEAQTMRLDFNDSTTINMSKGPIFRARVKVNLAGATMSADQRFVIGLASAYNATLDNVTTNAWFRGEGANLNIYLEGDDGTTDTDDQDSTVDYADDVYQIFEIDCTSLSAVTFRIYNSTGTALSGSGTVSLAALAANTLVQPLIAIQRDAGTEQEVLDIDFIQILQQRT